MKVQKIFILTVSLFIHAVGMELQITHSGEQELDLNAFIDKMYQCKNNRADFITLSKACRDEHKSSLINYFLEKARGLTKEDMLNQCCQQDKFYIILEDIVAYNAKKNVKYYIPNSNAWRCIALLKKEIGIKDFKDEWSQYKTFAELMENDITAQKTMKDICSFFSRESNVDNFTDIYNDVYVRGNIVTVELIKAAAQVQNMSVLTLLLFGKYEAVEGDKINQYIYDACDKEREIIMKADYFIDFLEERAIKEKAVDKAWSFWRIYIAQGHHKYHSDERQFASQLLREDFKVTTDIIKDWTCKELKIYVMQGYKIQGKNFWDDKAHHLILHKAVQENNKEFVEYLLSLDVPTNVIDENSKTPILYSLNNDEIFNILVKIPPRALEAGEKNDHELFRTLGYVSKPIDNLTAFIENNPEEKIIQLFQEKFFSKKAVSNWLDCAVELNKYDLFVFLVNKYQENISEEQQQMLVSCAIQKERYGFARYLLKQELEVDQLKFIESVNQHSNNNDILCSLLNEVILEKNEEKVTVILQQLENHIKNITKEQANLLLKSALEADNSTIIDFLIKNECVSIRDMQDYIAQMQPGYNIILPDQFSIIVERCIEENEQEDITQTVPIEEMENKIVHDVNQCTEGQEQKVQDVENQGQEKINDSQEEKKDIVDTPEQFIEQIQQVEELNNQEAELVNQATIDSKDVIKKEISTGGFWYGIQNCISWGIWLVSTPIRLLAHLISLFV